MILFTSIPCRAAPPNLYYSSSSFYGPVDIDFSVGIPVTLSTKLRAGSGEASTCLALECPSFDSVSQACTAIARPAGLILAANCTITGTPQVEQDRKFYLITASNADGTQIQKLSIRVLPEAPRDLTYSTPAIYRVGVMVPGDLPTARGGRISNYSISPSLQGTGLNLDANSGKISGIPTIAQTSKFYSVIANNASGSTSFRIEITINNAPAVNFYYNVIIPNSFLTTVGSPIQSRSLYYLDGALNTFAFVPTLVTPSLPTGLSINPNTGIVSGTPTRVTPFSNYQISARNIYGQTVTAQFGLGIKDILPNISFGFQSFAFLFNSYFSISPTNMGGSVVTCTAASVPSGINFPAGLSLSSNCTVSGTPNVPTSLTPYVITASNSGGDQKITISLQVPAPPPPPSYPFQSSVYRVGELIQPNLPINTSGITSFVVTPAFPAGSGIIFNSQTGAISGTPTRVDFQAKNYAISVVGTRSGVSPPNAIFSFPPLQIFVLASVPRSLNFVPNISIFTVGVAIAAETPSFLGGPVDSYTVVPPLPAGISMDTKTGILSGTPLAPTPLLSYAVTANNSVGSSSPATLLFKVNPAPPKTLSYSTQSALYRKAIGIADNTPTSLGGTIEGYSIDPAQMPSGLSFDLNTGKINGTPTATQAKTFYTVLGRNISGSTTTRIDITVNEAPANSFAYTVPQANTYTVGLQIQNRIPVYPDGALSGFVLTPPLLLPNGLVLDPNTGIVSGKPLVASNLANYTVSARNTFGQTVSAVIGITVRDAPPNLTYRASNFFLISGYQASILPNLQGQTGITCTTSGLPTGLVLLPNCTINGTPITQSQSTYSITATNTGGTQTIRIGLQVLPPPIYLQSTLSYRVGIPVEPKPPLNSTQFASFSIQPVFPNGSGLTFNSRTGIIGGTPNLFDFKRATYIMTVTGSPNTDNLITAPYIFPPLSISILPSTPRNLYYSASPLTFTVGSMIAPQSPSYQGGPVDRFVAQDPLPNGLTLNPVTGVISGTPTAAAATKNFLIFARNQYGTSNIGISITVNPAPPIGLTYSVPNASYQKGILIIDNLPIAQGGKIDAFTITPALPQALTLDPLTGVIKGASGVTQISTSYTIKGSNVSGFTTTQVMITVLEAPPTALTYSSQEVTYYTQTSILSNNPTSRGGPVSSYSVSPALPTGLTLGSDGKITGVPTLVQNPQNYIVRASNASGNTTSTISITIKSGAAPTGLSYNRNNLVLTSGSPMTPYSPTSTGGTILSYAISPGGLPAGLSFSNNTGIISGTPTGRQAATPYRITGTNSNGSTSTDILITVQAISIALLTYDPPAVTLAVGGTSFQMRPTLSGGDPTVRYSVAPGLPTGITIDPITGIIAGTPAANWTQFAYTVTAANFLNSSAARVLITPVISGSGVPKLSVIYNSTPLTASPMGLITLPTTQSISTLLVTLKNIGGGTLVLNQPDLATPYRNGKIGFFISTPAATLSLGAGASTTLELKLGSIPVTQSTTTNVQETRYTTTTSTLNRSAACEPGEAGFTGASHCGYGGVGRCENGQKCVGGYSGNTSYCAYSKSQGTICTLIEGCGDGLYCDNGSGQYLNGTNGSTGTCVRKKATGESCSFNYGNSTCACGCSCNINGVCQNQPNSTGCGDKTISSSIPYLVSVPRISTSIRIPTNAGSGQISNFVTVLSNDPTLIDGEFTFQIKGKVQNAVDLQFYKESINNGTTTQTEITEADTYDLGTIIQGTQPITQTLKIKPMANCLQTGAQATCNTYSLSGNSTILETNSPFSINSTINNTLPLAISKTALQSVGQNQTVTLRFDPSSLPAGQYRGTYVVSYSERGTGAGGASYSSSIYNVRLTARIDPDPSVLVASNGPRSATQNARAKPKISRIKATSATASVVRTQSTAVTQTFSVQTSGQILTNDKEIFLGTTKKGRTITQTVLLTNTSGVSVRPLSNQAGFTVDSLNEDEFPAVQQLTENDWAPNETRSLKVAYSGSNQTGVIRTGSLVVLYARSDDRTKFGYFFINLSGITPLKPTGNINVIANGSIIKHNQPSEVELGTVSLDGPSPVTQIIVKNNSNQPVTVSSVTVRANSGISVKGFIAKTLNPESSLSFILKLDQATSGIKTSSIAVTYSKAGVNTPETFTFPAGGMIWKSPQELREQAPVFGAFVASNPNFVALGSEELALTQAKTKELFTALIPRLELTPPEALLLSKLPMTDFGNWIFRLIVAAGRMNMSMGAADYVSKWPRTVLSSIMLSRGITEPNAISSVLSDVQTIINPLLDKMDGDKNGKARSLLLLSLANIKPLVVYLRAYTAVSLSRGLDSFGTFDSLGRVVFRLALIHSYLSTNPSATDAASVLGPVLNSIHDPIVRAPIIQMLVSQFPELPSALDGGGSK